MVAEPWPTVEEQKAYWRDKEMESIDKEQLLKAVDAMAEFLDEMQKAITKMRSVFDELAKQ